MDWYVLAGFLTVFGMVIGAYVIVIKNINDTNKKLAEIYKLVNTHIQNGGIHQLNEHYVRRDVCDAMREPMLHSLNELEKDMKATLSQVTTIAAKMNGDK